jgi:hypothetical protein
MESEAATPLNLLLLVLACLLIWFFIRQAKEWNRQKQIISAERDGILGQPIPSDIGRDIQWAAKGGFDGEELSPLSYLGYRVGKTNGLSPKARRRRLRACLSIEMPTILPGKYRRWGRPVTYQRYASIFNHLLMLANQRRGRSNYQFAVADWEADAQWMKAEFEQMAISL